METQRRYLRSYTAERMEEDLKSPPMLDEFPYLAIIARPHRFFVPGDLVLYSIENGGAQRFRVWSVSSKGIRVTGYHMLFFRWSKGRSYATGLFKQIWLPGDLGPGACGTENCRCLPPDSVRAQALDHPAVQSYLRDLMEMETLTRK